eukprot:7026-Heterococcus_DN1.PRE.3
MCRKRPPRWCQTRQGDPLAPRHWLHYRVLLRPGWRVVVCAAAAAVRNSYATACATYATAVNGQRGQIAHRYWHKAIAAGSVNGQKSDSPRVL